MAKRDRRFGRNEGAAVCERCNAPGNPRKRGGQLVPLKGFRGRNAGEPRQHRRYQHADAAFCALRIPTASRRPKLPGLRYA